MEAWKHGSMEGRWTRRSRGGEGKESSQTCTYTRACVRVSMSVIVSVSVSVSSVSRLSR